MQIVEFILYAVKVKGRSGDEPKDWFYTGDGELVSSFSKKVLEFRMSFSINSHTAEYEIVPFDKIGTEVKICE